jgi:hypothetical protein
MPRLGVIQVIEWSTGDHHLSKGFRVPFWESEKPLEKFLTKSFKWEEQG